ncbi:MAG: hypothetical protein O2954_18465, partial [bacterium]|nr:hypothetical protein [bacterium]
YDWSTEEGVRAIYSVAPVNPDTLWVTGGALQKFIKLNLTTGTRESYPWGGGRFITAGMALDPSTGKLFAGAQTALLSFDTKSGKTVRIYSGAERPPENHHYDHWRMPDGSYGFILETPGLSYLRWDPKTESVSWQRLTDDSAHPTVGCVRHLKYTDKGQVYVPHMGWFDGLTGKFTPHNHPPETEASWFGQMGQTVFGVQWELTTGAIRIVRWDTTTGRTHTLLIATNTTPLNCALTKSGKILLVDIYGCFRRYNADSGALEVTKQIGPEHEHSCNVIVPVDESRVTGTPFISQNFWVFDHTTKKGYCAGRAGGSFGQVDYGVNVNGKIYFAIYGGGQLTEYDPDAPAGYPINPRLVAATDQGQHGAGITTDGQLVWAAFKPKYGTLDGAMIRYNTKTGAATYREGALQAQHIINPIFENTNGTLVAGTSWLADAESATPVHSTAFAVVLNPDTMDIVAKAPAPEGVDTAINYGPIGHNQWLFQCANNLFVFDTASTTLAPYEKRPNLPEDTVKLLYAGKPGHFLIQIGTELQQWNTDTNTFEPLATFAEGFVNRWWIHGPDLTFDCGSYAAVWRNCL